MAFWAKGPPAAASWLVWAGLAASRVMRWRQVVALVLASGALIVGTALAFDGLRLSHGLPSFWRMYLERQLWPSMVMGRAQPSTDALFYVRVLWRWYPAGLVLLGGLGLGWPLGRAAAPAPRTLARLGALWLLTIVLPFSVMRQKYQWYIHPCAWGFAWLGGAWWAALAPRPAWRRAATVLVAATTAIYLLAVLLRPASFLPRAERARQMARVTPPSWQPDQSDRVGLCDGPWTWRESHTAGFVWGVRAVPCDDPSATVRYDGRDWHPTAPSR